MSARVCPTWWLELASSWMGGPGVQTAAAKGTRISPLSFGASGLLRHVAVNEFSASPKRTNDLAMTAFAVDAFIPIIQGWKKHMGNSLSLTGEFGTGYRIADMYTSLTRGASFPALPNPTNANPAPTYAPDIDPGIVTYYFPGADGRFWISGNYAHTKLALLREVPLA